MSRTTFLPIRHLAAGVALGLATFSVLSADDLPEGGLRITPEELKWKPGWVP